MNEAMGLGPWRLERMLGRDVSGTYYTGRRDDGERATLHLLSGEVAGIPGESLTGLLGLHRELSHPGLVRLRGLDHDGSDRYLIADPVDDALAPLRGARRPAPGQARALGAALAAALATAHDRGLIHGGLDLDNVLWAPGRAPQILGTGVAALGIADPAALAYGDVAALGRLLCALVAGRRPPGAGGEGFDSAGAGHLDELVRLLADPGAAISMADALTLLTDGEPTQAARAPRGIVEALTIDDLPRRPGGRPARAAATGMPPTPDHAREEADAAASGSPASPAPAPLGGQIGRYRILTRLGRGGMGEVFLAEDPALRRSVAIKRIRRDLEHDRTFRARLRREARLAAHLSHRAIVQVFDLVTDDTADHVVMEYVPGPSLHTLAGDGPTPVSEVLRIAAEIADGLAYAHQHGVIHRDLKLENILIGTDDQPKIADFGIAHRVAGDGDDGESLTGDGVAVGTTRAMSPEQIHGHALDARSDLFSFGVLLYELVTGTSPFTADSRIQTILRVLHHRQPAAHEVLPEVPRALSDLIDQLLEKTPAQRPDSALAVRDRLRNLDRSPQPHTDPRPAAEPTLDPSPTSTVVASPAGGERRQVTLACVDLAAASGTDGDDETFPELLADVLPAFRARVDEIVARFDGAVISALGHRFAACFGHPRPLEDAARRAVLAGRAMIEAAGELRSVDPVHAGARFTARAAVHTGLAVVRGRGAGEELVLGATIDAALRLLQLGEAGDLWISGSAARLVETDFQLEPPAAPRQGEASARRFAGARVGSGAGSGEHDRPMVGRDHEMQLLLGSWRRARKGHGQVAVLIGDPGIGKSRLTRELALAIAGDKPRQIALRGSAHRQRSALEPVADTIAALFGLGTDAAPADGLIETTDRIRALTGPDEAEQVVHLLGRAANLPLAPPERARHQLLGGLRDVLVGTSHEVPTLLIVEDLQWLDPSTLDLLALVIQDIATSPLFLLMTTRPGFQRSWPAAATITQLRLDRLEASAIDVVIAQACADRALPATERALIATRSEGVPLYAEELVRAALELGRTGEIPSTLRDALTARLHQLGPTATWIAQVAAVAGRDVTADLIAAAGGLDRAAIDQELDRLVAAEILFRRRGRAREVYQFSHALLQQAAYEELLATSRRHLHGQLADVLLADERAGRDPGPDLVAHHLAGARRFDEAVASAHRAAHRAASRHARVEARELLRQALTWLDQLPESAARDRTEIGLRMELNAVLITTEGYTSPELARSCQRTETLCERHDDMPLPVKYGLWLVRFMSGSPETVESLLGWFAQVIDRGAPPVERMMAHVAIALHGISTTRYDRACAHFERSIALFVRAEHAGVVQLYGGAGGFYGHVLHTPLLWKIGRFADARRHARDTLALAETLDPYALGCALTFEMMLHVDAGDTARTEAYADRIHEIATRYEFSYLTCWALCGRGWALARRGQLDRAMTDLVMGTEGIKRIGVKIYSAQSLAMLADGAIMLGQFDRAERALDDAVAVCRTNIDRSHEPELLRLRGHLILGRDASAHAPARAAFADALAVAQRHGERAMALHAATDLAALLRDDHLPDEAIAVLGPVYHGFAPELDDPSLAAARQLLVELSALSPGTGPG